MALPEEACSGCGQGRLNTVPAPYAWLNENAPGEPILELPAGPSEMPVEGEPPLSGHDNTYQFYYALDGIPRVNGTTSWPPIPYLELLEELEEFPGPRSLAAIRSWGPVHWLVVHGDRYEAAQWARIEALLESPPEGLSLVRAWGPVRLYRLAAPGDS